MPQINQLLLVYQSQWFWLLLVLAVIYFGIARGMAPKIEATVDARDRQIASDLAAAEKARAATDVAEEALRAQMIEAKAEAQAVAAKAKAKGAQDAENRVAKADAEIGAKMAAADKALAKARDKALESLETLATDAATDIVAKLSGVTVAPANATKAVKAFLNG